jgi:predicted aspartyl protease
MGHPIPQTIILLGHIDHHPLTILIDSGSTHNFIQDRIATQLGLTLEPTQSFQVLVGNGEELNWALTSVTTPPFLLTPTFF